MFEKLVAVEPVLINQKGRDALLQHAKETEYYGDMPKDAAETARRIGDADAVLVSFTTPIGADVLAACPNIQYIGMCCSLYNPESANVDIREAEKRGIVVKGIRDYGDEGVPEYVVYQLVRLLHGFEGEQWRAEPTELTGIPVGILGMGTTGNYVGRALRFFGAEVYYYSRTRKPQLEETEGYIYAPLDDVLQKADILITCLNRGAVLLGEREFKLFGNDKILVNISIGPGHEVGALQGWLDAGRNFAFCDTSAGLDPSGGLLQHPRVRVVGQSAGKSVQAVNRLTEKALANIEAYEAGK